MRDVIELVVSLGETTLEQCYLATGKHRFRDVELDADGLTLGGSAIAARPIGSSWVRCKTGLLEVSARRTAPPRRHALAASIGDRRSAGYVAASLAVHLAVWAIVADHPAEVTVQVDPPEHIGTRVVGAFPTATTQPAWQTGDSPDYDLDGGGKPSLGLEAKAGAPSPRDRGHARLVKRDTPTVTREAAIESARTAGILGSASLRAEGFAAITGTADPASGFDTTDVQGPLYGGTGAGAGSFGLGRTGFGDSAGCQGASCDGLIGVGRYGTISNGRSIGDHWGGHLSGASNGIPRKLPTVLLCAGPHPCAVGIGGLDKEVIRRHIRRNLSKFQYCYEKELLAHAELDGTVETHFLISTDGTVSMSEGSGVSEPVSTCVAGVIKNIAFPKFRDGATEVHYPFTFRRVGS